MKEFKVGDRVHWKSQARGSVTRKEGVIVRVVDTNEEPGLIAFNEFGDYVRMFDGYRIPQGASEAYLVSVKWGKSGKARPRLYMPYPSRLTKV